MTIKSKIIKTHRWICHQVATSTVLLLENNYNAKERIFLENRQRVTYLDLFAGGSNAVTHSKKGWQKEKGHNPRHYVFADQYGRPSESPFYQDRADCKFNRRLRVVKGS